MNPEHHPLPAPLEHTAVCELAKCFCACFGKPRQTELAVFGFTDLADLLLRGWIEREPGRYSIGYLPGPPVIREMWRLRPALCEVLRLPPPKPIQPEKTEQPN